MDIQYILEVIRAVFWSLLAVIYAAFLGLYSGFKILFPGPFQKDVNGKTVLITGGGSGLGRLVALKLAKRGALIVLWDISQKGNEETLKLLKPYSPKSIAYTVNLCNKKEIYEAAEKVKKDIGQVDILVNNAGTVSGDYLLDLPDEKIELTYKVNILAHFWTLKSFLPNMIKKGQGHIVSIASLAGISAVPKLTDYCSSKFAVVGLDDALRTELYVKGLNDIKCTIICPFFISTGMFEGVQSKIQPILTPEMVTDRIVKAILLEEEMVVLPSWIKLYLSFRPLLPFPALHFVLSSFGFIGQMETFTGRAKND